jgi:hypothetical protein
VRVAFIVVLRADESQKVGKAHRFGSDAEFTAQRVEYARRFKRRRKQALIDVGAVNPLVWIGRDREDEHAVTQKLAVVGKWRSFAHAVQQTSVQRCLSRRIKATRCDFRPPQRPLNGATSALRRALVDVVAARRDAQHPVGARFLSGRERRRQIHVAS